MASTPGTYSARLTAAQDLLPFRTRHRAEVHGQIVHDALHRREGWCRCYALEYAGVAVGFGSIAIAGPWQGKPTAFEFYLLPEHRLRAFALFEKFLEASGARFFEAQTNETLFTSLALACAGSCTVDKIVFADGITTAHALAGARLLPTHTGDDMHAAVERCQGGGEWTLEVDGAVVGKGGILFHYNRPFGDVYMEIDPAFRRRGLGTFLVQELKRISYEFGALPCARCNPDNVASRRTLQGAGFVPHAQILAGALTTA